MSILCDCGLTRTVGGAYSYCRHCDQGCEKQCARCKDYARASGKRISA